MRETGTGQQVALLHERLMKIMMMVVIQGSLSLFLTHCGPVKQICVFTLQLCKTDEANLRF